MDKPQAGIAFVPADKQVFTLNEVIELLALTRWPEVQGRWASYPLKFTAPGEHGNLLTDSDRVELLPLWKLAKLPAPAFPMLESEWACYLTAFNQSDAKPAWALGCCVEDHARAFGMLRVAAEEEFKDALIVAIRNGDVTARAELTFLAVPVSHVTVGFRGLVMSREDLERFAASALIEIRIAPGKAAALARAERIEARCQELKAQGVIDWQRTVSREEGVSVTRIKQIRAGVGRQVLKG